MGFGHPLSGRRVSVLSFSQERERERYYTFPALRLMQVLPGHALADSTEHIKQKVAAIEDGCNTRTSQHCPAITRICISQGSKPKKHT